MARVKKPILFSSYFNVDPGLISQAGLINPFLNVDTQLFIDPILLEKSANAVIRDGAVKSFANHFSNIVRLLTISKDEGDAPWRGAQRLLNLHEPPQTGLGYGGSGTSGSSRPDEIRDSILRTSKQIVDLGSSDPDMISLMGFFEENVGPDTISDFTTRVIVDHLAKITNEFCLANRIPVKKSDPNQPYALPYYVTSNRKERALLLVPRDIVRDLPVAESWAELNQAIDANRQIRDRVNLLLAGIAKPTVTDRKDALRKAVLGSQAAFDLFIASIKSVVSHYDPNQDAMGYYALKAILESDPRQFLSKQPYDFSKGADAILAMVRETIAMFKHHVEKGNLWEQLWVNGTPKRERAAQLIYFAIADCFCKANNIDINPEANMGGGPVDFKFSKGYQARVLVELKKSGGTVVHGYQTQLEIYKQAAGTFHGIFVVINYGDMGDKLRKIESIRDRRLANGEPASEIVVIDATPKASASKRK